LRQCGGRGDARHRAALGGGCTTMSARLLVRIGGLHTIDADLPSFRPTHLIGILDPTMPDPAAYAHEPESRAALVMRFRDSEAGTEEGPQTDHVVAMLALIE